MIRIIRQYLARRRLSRHAKENASSYETLRWIERRNAALKSPRVREPRERARAAITARRMGRVGL